MSFSQPVHEIFFGRKLVVNKIQDNNTGEDFHSVTTSVVFYLNKGFTPDQWKGVKIADDVKEVVEAERKKANWFTLDFSVYSVWMQNQNRKLESLFKPMTLIFGGLYSCAVFLFYFASYWWHNSVDDKRTKATFCCWKCVWREERN